MLDHRDISWEDTVDPQACNGPPTVYKEKSRDPARTPFQWDNTTYGGFTDRLQEGKKLWLPLHPNYWRNNLKNQKDDPDSIYNYYKKLIELRQTTSIQYGGFVMKNLTDHVLAWVRPSGGVSYVVVANLGLTRQTVDLTEFGGLLTSKLTVALPGVISQYRAG